jgi:hypothetical protein
MLCRFASPGIEDGSNLPILAQELVFDLVPTKLIETLKPGSLGHQVRQGFADLPPSREIPFIRKIAALLRFYFVDYAVISLEEEALPVILVDEGQSVSLLAKPRVPLNEIVQFHPDECGDLCDLRLADFYLARPPATRCTALAAVVDVVRHTPPIRENSLSSTRDR